MVFRNSVVGGTTLVRPAIKSPNYVAGVSGWSINADGTAEFNDVVVRGDLSSDNYVAGVSGWHLDEAGSAEFNDVTIRGTSAGDDIIIGPTGLPQVRIGSTASAGYMSLPTNRSIENTTARILAGFVNGGAANEFATLNLLGPTVTGATDGTSILLSSQNNDGSSNANIQMNAGTGDLDFDQDLVSLFGPRLDVRPSASANTGLVVDIAAGHTGTYMSLARAATPKFQITSDARIFLVPDVSASSAVLVSAPTGYTGNLQRLQVNGTDMFRVDPAGVIGTYAADAWNAYTPTVTGGGAATFTSRTGYWQRIGKIVQFVAFIDVNAAGSGAGNVTITAPTSIDRTTRQTVFAHCDNITPAQEGSCAVVAFVGGSGSTFDRLRARDNSNVTGADLLAGALITVQGWYREA